MPGTDHAGIATQVVVERQLAAEGTTARTLGREAFVARVWQWKEESGGTIIRQLKRLGASCDWERERFTMDPGLSRGRAGGLRAAVGRGADLPGRLHRQLVSALPDRAVGPRGGARGAGRRVRTTSSTGRSTLGTVRPETKLGDTALAVHPKDRRYAKYVGKDARGALGGGDDPMQVVADAAVDPKFGTGVIKVTPGHDPTDFEIGRRHGLPRSAASSASTAR